MWYSRILGKYFLLGQVHIPSTTSINQSMFNQSLMLKIIDRYYHSFTMAIVLSKSMMILRIQWSNESISNRPPRCLRHIVRTDIHLIVISKKCQIVHFVALDTDRWRYLMTSLCTLLRRQIQCAFLLSLDLIL